MYRNIKNQLEQLKNKELIAVIDEGRSRKTQERCRIRGIYNRIFTIEISNNCILSFSYSDLICKTITLKMV